MTLPTAVAPTRHEGGFGAGNGVIGVRSRVLSIPRAAIGSHRSINRMSGMSSPVAQVMGYAAEADINHGITAFLGPCSRRISTASCERDGENASCHFAVTPAGLQAFCEHGRIAHSGPRTRKAPMRANDGLVCLSKADRRPYSGTPFTALARLIPRRSGANPRWSLYPRHIEYARLRDANRPWRGPVRQHGDSDEKAATGQHLEPWRRRSRQYAPPRCTTRLIMMIRPPDS